jgi:hypothetical protein
LFFFWQCSIRANGSIIKKRYTAALKVIQDNNIKSYLWDYRCGAYSPAGNLQGESAPNIAYHIALKDNLHTFKATK